MSAFSSLSEFWQTMLPFIMLVEIVLEIGLFMYQLLRSNKPVRSLLSLAVMAVMIPLLFSVSRADPDNIGDAFLLGAPWLIFAAAIFLAAVHFAIALPREYRRKKNELSPFSIKEATDKLPMGICFADPNGRIILCNNRMRRLSFALCGHELQIKSDMENALSVPDRSVTVKDDCYILPDKTVWQFRTQTITVESDDRWQQITAHNVTELYNGYQKQEEINEELAEVNRKLRKMYARMEDDVKEKESLDLKVYIHDTIGRSLLTIRDIIDSGEDTERKLETLQNAIGMLASNRVTSVSTMDEVKRTAQQLGVAVKIDGYLPRDTAAEELTAKQLGVAVEVEGYLPRDTAAEELTVAAAKECVTNCIKHADGNEVYIRIAQRGERYDVTITNNGKIPTEPIKEGSGLSTLRRSIESSGGEMHISHNPRFALLITIPAKENEL